MERRGFLSVAGCAAATAVLPGCASLVATPVTPVGGAIRIVPRNFAQLEVPGGWIRLRPDGGSELIVVLALEGGRYAALSPVCTHLQCTVNVTGSVLLCPCHGSTYDREGRVLRGPAERPLRTFPLTVEPGGDLVIAYAGAGS